MDTFGQYVKNLRKSKGLGLREAAAVLKISSAYLARVEGDQDKPPALSVLRRMAEIYDVDADEIIKRSRLRVLDDVRERAASGPELLALFRAVRNFDATTVKQVIRDAIAKGNESLSQAEIDRAADDLVDEMRRLSQQELHRNGRAGIFGVDLRPQRFSRAWIERYAHTTLAKNGYSADKGEFPVQLDRIVELTSEVDVVWHSPLKCMEAGQSEVMGLSRWSERDRGRWTREIHINPALVEKQDCVTQHLLNFTLAHEYFHCLKHLPLMLEPVSGGQALLRSGATLVHSRATDGFNVWRQGKDTRRKLVTNEDWREWQSNEFASHLLAPRGAVLKKLSAMKKQLQEAASEAVSANDACFILAGKETGEGRRLNDAFGVSRKVMSFQLSKFGVFED